MGRKARSDTPGELVALRLSASEKRLLEELQLTHGLPSRSETLRWALGVAAGVRSAVPEARALAHGLIERAKRIAEKPLYEGECLVRVADLKRMKATDVETLVLPALERLITAHVVTHGWPYPPTAQTAATALAEVRSRIVQGPNYFGMAKPGVEFLRAQIPAFWQTRKGPVESTQQPANVRNVLRHRLGLIKHQKPVDLTLASFRIGLIRQLYAVSFFRPAVAAGVYRRWLGAVERPRVWDPSAGFGARMLGFFAAYPGGTYVAHEPASATYRDLQALAADMPGTVELHHQGSEFADWEENTFDLVFTSPPYFDLEKYFDEPGQVWVEYPDMASWRDRQVYPTLVQATKGVKPGGYVIINISHEHRATFILEALRVGLRLVEEEFLSLRRSSLAKSGANKKGSKTEPILVFQKPEVSCLT